MTREQIVEGLKAGRTLVIDRRDAPEWPICMELEQEGLVTSEFKQIDEQSSCMKYRWKIASKVRHKETGKEVAFSGYNYHGVGEFIATFPDGDASSEFIKDYDPIDENGNVIGWPPER